MKPITPVFLDAGIRLILREMRRIREGILKNECVLIKNRIYPFRLLMKRKVGSVSRPSCLIQMMKLKFLIKIGIKD